MFCSSYRGLIRTLFLSFDSSRNALKVWSRRVCIVACQERFQEEATTAQGKKVSRSDDNILHKVHEKAFSTAREMSKHKSWGKSLLGAIYFRDKGAMKAEITYSTAWLAA